MLTDYMRRKPPKPGSAAEAAWLCLQELPPEERDEIVCLVESLHLETPKVGLHTALEIIWKVGLLWAGQACLDNSDEGPYNHGNGR